MWERVKKSLPVVILAIIGLGVSVMIEVVHRRLAADVNYASFCNVSANVNCDVVLSSRYAWLAGISVGVWAILFYIGVLVVALGASTATRAKLRGTFGTLTFTAAIWGLLFSIYMAAIAFAILHAVCLMCTSLYLVNIGLFGAAWRLRAKLKPSGRRQATERAGQDRMVVIASILVAVVLVGIGSWEAFGRSAHLASASDIERQRPDFYRWYFAQPRTDLPDHSNRNTRGRADAPVTIVEFSDFECGHCAAFHKSLDEVLHRVGRNVRVVFRHFPLDAACNPTVPTHVHPQACLAAIAAECAAEQGKFWQYHNVLFDHQQELGRSFLMQYAARLGLDGSRFAECLGSADARARVEHDVEEATQLGIDSTPTIFINGRTIKGALEPELLSNALTLARTQR
jgi:protein-disulfide isomerase/uncharacterized membrane protein